MDFHNPHIGFNTRLENSHIYKELSTPNRNRTPIEQKVEIQIGNNPSHIITRIQFLVQLIGRTIHCAQGLTFEHLAFDPVGVTKHGLTYITLFQICYKKKSYLLSPLSTNFFQIDHLTEQEMYQLQNTA
jgi:hypothetical protein